MSNNNRQITVIGHKNPDTDSICSAIVTNCVKLVPLSQLAGQKILGESFELISSASEKALFTDINDIGISGAGFDLRAMQHERLYSRQYMS